MLQEVKGLKELEDSESRKELTLILFQQVVYVINEVYTTTFQCSK